MSCDGPCAQGRQRCPAPEACQLADINADNALETLGAALVCLAIAAGVALLYIVSH